MSPDARIIIATVVATNLVIAGLLAGVMYALIAGVNARIDDLRGDMRDMRADIRDMRASIARLDGRLDSLEVTVAKMDQRLSTIERAVIPPAAAGG